MRNFGMLIFCLVLIAGLNQMTWADEFPGKPITLVCASKPGAPVDVMARVLGQVGKKYTDQPINVLTKAGGGGGLALAYVYGKPADGYHLITATRTILARTLMGRIPLTVDDFEPLCMVQSDPYTLAARMDAPFSDFKGMIEYARRSPKNLKVAGFAVGSMQHLLAVDIGKTAGFDFTYIPYDGAADALAAVLGGKADVVTTAVPLIVSHHKNKKVNALAHSGFGRIDVLPNVPTLKESGYDMEALHWRTLWVKKGTPGEILKKLETLFAKIIDDPDFKAHEIKSGSPHSYLGSKELKRFIEKDAKNLKKNLNELGLVKK